MNTLKKKAQVILLDSQDDNSTPILVYNPSTKELILRKRTFTTKNYKEAGFSCYDLYFIIDERPKTGEWFIILDGTNSLKQCTSVEEQYINFKEGFCTRPSVCWKVIATTDKNLKIIKKVTNPAIQEHILIGNVCSTYEDVLPQPSESFIQKYISEYNKGNTITEVMVDYETKLEWVYSHSGDRIQEESNPFIKVDKNNCITITRCKDSWSGEEVVKLLKSLYTEFASYPTMNLDLRDNWINQNL